MSLNRNALVLLPALLIAASMSAGCKRITDSTSARAAASAPAPAPGSGPPDGPQNRAVETETVTPQAIAGGILATGKILVPEDRMANIGPVHEGRLSHLYAGQGSVVRKGQKLADLESQELDDAEADYLKALADSENARRTSAAEIKLAQATYDRTKMLFEQTITAGKNLQSAEHDLEVAKASAANSLASTKAALTAARRRLIILGLKEAEIDTLPGRTGPAVFSLTSPIEGIVVERNATIGATVGSDASLFKIINLSSVWIDANVFEKDLQRVKLGQGVRVTVPAFPGTSFAGRVILVSSVVDPDTRTVKVRTEVPNHDARLKPDMFANVEIITDSSSSAISVPQSAVLDDAGKPVVFVAADNGYEKRAVTTGVQSGDRIEIRDGLKGGERVVVKGNYLLLQQSKPEQ